MHLVLASIILGVVAVWGVPLIASLLNSILPASVQPYLPSQTSPAFTAQAVITALVYGLLVFLTLVALEGAAKMLFHKKVKAGV